MIFFIFATSSKTLLSQCTPPAADTCEQANVLCDLESINGYSCKNTDKSNEASCKPLCPQGGIANNISWWAFITEGGPITIKIEVSNCSVTGTGVQIGIWTDCSCTDSVACFSSCNSASSIEIKANLNACQKYYLFVDGCTQDVCDFVISTVGGKSPKVDTIDGIAGADTLCPSNCLNTYSIIGGTSVCRATYKWTINKNVVQVDTSRKLDTFFEFEGSYEICVTGSLGNFSDTITTCATYGPVCKTIFVTTKPVLFGSPITLCTEDLPYKWHNQTVTGAGVYTQRFTVNCCDYDSMLTFIVKPPPLKPDFYFLACKGDTFYDNINKVNYTSCQNGIDIIIKDVTIPDRCDSSYRLFATFLDISATIKEYCENGKVFIETDARDITCSVNSYGTLGIDYSWYKNNDKANVLSTNSKFEISSKDDYCVDITVRGQLSSINKSCTFTYCEKLDEDAFNQKKVCPKGDLEVCRGETARYTSDTIFPPNVKHIWNVSNGTILTPNPINNSTIDIQWDFDPGQGIPFIGKICYHYESDCPPSPECCIEINVHPFPRPSAGPDKSTCGLINTIDGKFDVGGFDWREITNSPVTISPSNVPNPTVTVQFYRSYIFVITETNFGCTASDTVVLSFHQTPSNGIPTFICEPAQTSYTMKVDITDGKQPYRIIKGNGMIVNGNTFMSPIVNNGVVDTVIIEDANGCQLPLIFSHTCKCSNEIGIISTNLQKVCEEGKINVIYDKMGEILDPNPNRDTVIFFIYSDPTNPLSSIIRTLNNNMFGYDPLFTFGTTYYIGARLGRADGNGGIDLGKGCVKTSIGTPFIFVKNPTPFAGRDTSICGTQFLLEGFQSIAGTEVSWREVNNKSVIFGNDRQVTTTVEPRGGFGTYTFEFSETNDKLCTKTDQVTVVFNQNPELSNLNRFCTELGSSTMNPGKFKATIDLSKGTPPYTIVTPPSTFNGTINGSMWMSNELISLDSFIVQIQDANGCVSTIIRNTHNCNCGPIDAGKLDSNLIRVCQDKCVAVISILPEIINPTIETTMYVLHIKSPTPQILDTFFSLTDSICFDPITMKLGDNNPVFVTRIVGDDLNKDGIVDFDDLCQKSSNEMKIVFDDYPSPNAGMNDTICGLTTNLSGVLSFGTPSWRFVSGAGQAVFGTANAISTTVTVSQKGSYTFEFVGDNFGCIKNDLVTILFVDSPEFDSTSIIYECDGTAENYRIRIRGMLGDRPSWNLTGSSCNNSKILNGSFLPNSDVWQSDLIPSGCNFNLRLKDKFDCLTDTYTGSHICQCITKIDDIDLTPIHLCQDQSITVSYPNPPDTSVLDANDAIRYVLYDGTQNNPRAGNVISFNTTGVFNFLSGPPSNMILGKTYYISVFVGNLNTSSGNIDLNDRCFVNTPGKPVTWYPYPVAKITGDSLLTCTVTSISLDAGNSTSGSGDVLRYKWSTGDTIRNTQVILNGNYTVTVTDPRAGCTSTFVKSIDRKVDLPKIVIDTPLKFTCDRTLVTIDANKSDNIAKFKANWTGPNVVNGGNTFIATVGQIGRYKFLLENTETGCRDSAFIDVSENKIPPIARITQIGKLGCVFRQIKLDGSSSTGGVGSIGNYTWTGNIISGQNTSQITIGAPGGLFILEVKDSQNGCIDRDTITVTEEDNPLGFIQLDTLNPKCFGQNNGSITIKDILDKNGNILTDVEYSINGGPFSKNKDYKNLPKGVYTITVRDFNGCILSTQRILIEPGPIDITVKDVVADQGTDVNIDSLLLKVFGGTINQFGDYKDTTWFSLKDSIFLNNLIVTADTTQEFIITVIDQSGCEVSKKVRIIVKIIKDVWWPTLINPNSGLGENNRFNLYGKKVRNIKVLNIYSRWGELVYSAENFPDANMQRGLGWNGIFNGEPASVGVYAFYAEIEYVGSTGTDVVKGDFTLIR
ncbi:MAG: hypothetical protein HOP11_12785 [Saprospiraceae bacterium]|nr:hypothetical protein [Saprospiraceae bacterium]